MNNIIINFLFLLFIINISNISCDIDEWPSTESDHSVLQIVVPSHLTKNGGYAHRDALFGSPSYSKGKVVTPLMNGNSTGCENNFMKFDSIQSPFALLLDRGDCHFVQKVRNAQHVGASAVIIVDNTCLCSDSECLKSTGDTQCETILPYMADDESGGDITIPSMLIRKSDGNDFKKEIGEGSTSNVMVEFDWGIPSPDGRVEWTLWHSSWDEVSTNILSELQPIVEALGDRAFFTPHFVSYNGSNVGCHSEISNDACGNMCQNKGRYCLLDPSDNHDQTSGASGADIVRENLRRKCLWNITSTEDPGVGRKWWRYISEFEEKCNLNEKFYTNAKCANEILKSLDVDIDKINNCINPLGEDVDKINIFLEEELKDQTELQLLRLPALYVDGVHARGHVDAALALSMICTGYGTHDPPKVCECSDQNKMELFKCIKEGSYESFSKKHHPDQSSSSPIWWIVLTCGCVGMVGLVQWKRSQRHMRDEVRSILAEYMPLEDQSDADGIDSPRLHPAVLASVKSPQGFAPSDDFGDLEDDCA